MALLLLMEGADCNALNDDKWAPIHLAARRNQVQAFNFIADCLNIKSTFELDREKAGKVPVPPVAGVVNFDLNIRGGEQGWTTLHLTAYGGNTKVLLLLIHRNANPLKANLKNF